MKSAFHLSCAFERAVLRVEWYSWGKRIAKTTVASTAFKTQFAPDLGVRLHGQRHETYVDVTCHYFTPTHLARFKRSETTTDPRKCCRGHPGPHIPGGLDVLSCPFLNEWPGGRHRVGDCPLNASFEKTNATLTERRAKGTAVHKDKEVDKRAVDGSRMRRQRPPRSKHGSRFESQHGKKYLNETFPHIVTTLGSYLNGLCIRKQSGCYTKSVVRPSYRTAVQPPRLQVAG